MATRRCIQSLIPRRNYSTLLNNPNPYLYPIFNSLSSHFKSTQSITPSKPLIFSNIQAPFSLLFSRNFCSNKKITDNDDVDVDVDVDDEDEDEDEDGSEEDEESEDDVDDEREKSRVQGKSDEEKLLEASEIGYKVIGPLQESERDLISKPYEPVFAVVQIGSHQFKVSNGDAIFTEKLKYCDINDKLILNKVLMLGSTTQTMIGRPVLPDASVHAVVEEHALDAKVIIFKKKRRKNYRRTKGHRQELTKLRITDIEGIEKPEMIPPLKAEKRTAVEGIEKPETAPLKTKKRTAKKTGKLAVAA